MLTSYVGIDPGRAGGLVCLTCDGPTLVTTAWTTMPKSEAGVWRWISRVPFTDGAAVRVVIEKVGGYLRGSAGNVGSAMFAFGTSYGGLRMALVAAGLEEGKTFQALAPVTWQKRVGVEKRRMGEDKAAWKRRLQRRAQELYPRSKIGLAHADAFLLAHVCRLLHGGVP